MALANKVKAANLADITSLQVKTAWMDLADDVVHSITGKDFLKHTNVGEYEDIKRSHIKKIFMDNTPILSVDSVVDDAQNNTAARTLNDDSYVIKSGMGIIELKEPEDLKSGDPEYFTQGVMSVKIIYTYGYNNPPTDIILLASYIVAREGILWKRNTDAGISDDDISISGIKQLKIADFTATFINHEATHIDKTIERMIKRIRRKYSTSLGLGVV